MKLSIIIPEALSGTASMLTQELEGIDSEVLVLDWSKGLAAAQGEFICFLEEDSAVKRGSIAQNLQVFLENPLFRKLAMVSSPVDYPEEKRICYGYTEGAQRRFEVTTTSVHTVRVGSVPGAVIRRSSLIKVQPKLKGNINSLTMNVCLDLWEAGQRILLNPEALYYAPDVEQKPRRALFSRQVKAPVLQEWNREMVH